VGEGVSLGPRSRITKVKAVKHGVGGIESWVLLPRVDQYVVADEFQSAFPYVFFCPELTANISR
jgi:hypothetical protein